jgi:hypothetical protein
MSTNEPVKPLAFIATAVVTVLGVLAGLISLITFVTGKEYLPEIIAKSPTPPATPMLEPSMTPEGVYEPGGRIDAGKPIYQDTLRLEINPNSYALNESNDTIVLILRS